MGAAIFLLFGWDTATGCIGASLDVCHRNLLDAGMAYGGLDAGLHCGAETNSALLLSLTWIWLGIIILSVEQSPPNRAFHHSLHEGTKCPNLRQMEASEN